MPSTRIGPVDVCREHGVVRIRQRRGTGDLVLALAGLVGLAGAASIATNPVSVATWLLGPFVAAFTVFGLGRCRFRGASGSRWLWAPLGCAAPVTSIW